MKCSPDMGIIRIETSPGPTATFQSGSPHCSSVSLQKPLTGLLSWCSYSLVSTQQSGWGFSNVSQSLSLLS